MCGVIIDVRLAIFIMQTSRELWKLMYHVYVVSSYQSAALLLFLGCYSYVLHPIVSLDEKYLICLVLFCDKRESNV